VSTPLYILDTNILVHFVRDSELWGDIRQGFNLFAIDPKPIVSSVSHGELRSLSLQFAWGDAKLQQMEFCLDYFVRMNIDSNRVIKSYAELDHFSLSSGRKMGKNDLWIAASAVTQGATLITTDLDFDHLVPLYFDRIRIEPR
jgi:predicted nucleic acid-binding protein